jgi:hypothetical protein
MLNHILSVHVMLNTYVHYYQAPPDYQGTRFVYLNTIKLTHLNHVHVLSCLRCFIRR